MRTEARRLEADGDADARLERQRRAVRLNTWIDRDTGMGRWSATWDPETMVRLENRLDAQVQAMFHDTQPEGCPSDLLEKQSFLRAHALLVLLNGGGARLGRPEIVVVIDHTTTNDWQPVIDWGLPVDLPQRVLDDLYESAVVHTVVVRNGVIIDAPGELNLGRSSRLANRAQRRASARCMRRVRSRAVECVTAAPNCTMSSGGNTADCRISTTFCRCASDTTTTSTTTTGCSPSPPTGNSTIHFPDGSIMTTGPPKRNAA